MKSITFLFLFTFFSWAAHGQLEINQTKFDLGDLYIESPRFCDVSIKNNGDKHHFILRVEKPEDVVYMFSNRKILPDSTIILRLYVKPGSKGRFEENINLYLSDRENPVEISIKGNNQEDPRQNVADLQGCPDFNQNPTQVDVSDFDIRIRVIDDATGAPVKRASVRAFRNGTPYLNESTNKEGFIEEEGKVGLYYFEASHPDYEPAEKDHYINFRRNYVVIRLKRNENPELASNDQPKDTTSNPVADITIVDEPEEIDSVIEEPEIAIDTTSTPEVAEHLPFDEAFESYDDEHFKPSNIVFVIDVSSSMKDKGRLELLKISLHQLKEKLRPQDRVCIVTYSTTAKVFLESTTGDQKEKIGTLINKLYAGGYTAGGDGILLGYNQAKVNYIEGGNNQVIIVTDGGFNRGETEYKKKIAKEKEKRDIRISVVGIKDSKPAEDSMKEVAALGDGDYIDVNRVGDAESNIIRNILKNAYRF